jgi:hypothetical protein
MQFSRWQFITALDIATEVILFSFSLSLVSGLKMALGRKSIVVLAFAARLPYVGFTISPLVASFPTPG